MSTNDLAGDIARVTDLEVSSRVSEQQSPVAMPRDVVEAVISAAGEAMRNVDRHAGVRRVDLRVHRSRRQLTVEVSDRGRGLPPRLTPGFGITHSIVGQLERIGGAGEVVPRVGGGTTVRLTWPGRRRAQTLLETTYDGTLLASGPGVFAALGVPTLVANAYLVARYSLRADRPWWLFATGAAMLALSYATIHALGRRAPRWPALGGLVAALCSLCAIALHLGGTGSGADLRSWPIILAACTVTLPAYVAPWRAIPLLVLPLLAVTTIDLVMAETGDPFSVLGVLATVIVLPISACAIGSRVRAAEGRLARRREAVVAVLADRQRGDYLAAARDAHLEYVGRITVPFLDGVARGTLDPGDPQVREQARLFGIDARDDLYLPNFYNPALRAVVRDFRARGGQLMIRPGFPPRAHERLVGQILARLIPRLGQGHRVTLSPTVEPNAMARLVVTPPIDDDDFTALRKMRAWAEVGVAQDEFATTLHVPDKGRLGR